MARVKLILWPRENANGTFPIRIRITKGNKKSYIGTDYAVLKTQWEGEQVKNITGASRLNNLLTKLKGDAFEAMLNLETKNPKIGVSTIARSLRNPYTDFFVFGRKHAEKYNHPETMLTYEKYDIAFRKFETFLKKTTLLFTDINYALLEDFRQHLIALKNKPGTISSNFAKIKAVYNQAVKRGLVDRNDSPFYEFKLPRVQPASKNRLAKKEIDSIRKGNIAPGQLIWHARNVFLFQFNCMGMRIGDVVTLKQSRIRNGRLEYKMRKSVDNMSIKLTPEALEILSYYKDEKEYVFPFLSRTNPDKPLYKRIQSATASVNKNLKKMCDLLELDVKITTHVARHTWANSAKENGVPLSVIGQGLGHARDETTRMYFSQFPNQTLDDANELATRR